MRGKGRGDIVVMIGVCVCSLCVYMCIERIYIDCFIFVFLIFRFFNVVYRLISIRVFYC